MKLTSRQFRILFHITAIMLSVGVIFFIIGVNDEAAYHRKSIYEGPPFTYSYGWAFYLTGIAFMAILAAIATNIMLYERRHPYPKDMVGNSPELEEKSKFDFSEVEDKGHAEPGTHWFVYCRLTHWPLGLNEILDM